MGHTSRKKKYMKTRLAIEILWGSGYANGAEVRIAHTTHLRIDPPPRALPLGKIPFRFSPGSVTRVLQFIVRHISIVFHRMQNEFQLLDCIHDISSSVRAREGPRKPLNLRRKGTGNAQGRDRAGSGVDFARNRGEEKGGDKGAGAVARGIAYWRIGLSGTNRRYIGRSGSDLFSRYLITAKSSDPTELI